MLVSLSISNFRSFLGEQTFSMVASKRLGSDHLQHLMPIPNSDEFVLKTAIVYGANGAGKSNLFRALKYLKGLALNTQKKNAGTKREKFDFVKETSEPTSLDLQFIANGKLYQYGVVVSDVQIVEEWLLEIRGKKEVVIYERLTSSDGTVDISAPDLIRDSEKVAALVKIGGPQNQTFLSTVHANLNSSDIGDDLKSVLAWFGKSLSMIAPNAVYAPLGHELVEDSSFLKFAGDFLREASTGVDHLVAKKRQISEEELKSLVPSNIWKKYLEQFDDDEDGDVNVIRLPGGNNLIVEKAEGNRYFKVSVQAAHKIDTDNCFELDLSEESDGTRRLLDLVPALHNMKRKGGVFFVDEIDRSMHPMLVRKLLEFFLEACPDHTAQLILTTHESSLLDLDLVRRDEIWFAEKDNHLRTHLYSLMDFKVRSDLEIRKNYLNGRFGAIPFLGGVKRLTRAEGVC